MSILHDHIREYPKINRGKDMIWKSCAGARMFIAGCSGSRRPPPHECRVELAIARVQGLEFRV